MLPADVRIETPLANRYRQVRETSVALIDGLEPEDTVVQSMPDVSPTKWHLAHVSWFFERFVLAPHVDDYRPFDDDFDFLFNSYYYTAGSMHARPKRGLLSRPTLAEILEYRAHVDAAMQSLLETSADNPDVRTRVVLGIHHEQQHQELFLTDIKHVLSCNPLRPTYDSGLQVSGTGSPGSYEYSNGAGGIHRVGAKGGEFFFDNETPRHDALLHEHRIGSRLITNGEYREFIEDGGYRRFEALVVRRLGDDQRARMDATALLG